MDLISLSVCLAAYDIGLGHANRVLSEEIVADYTRKGNYVAEAIWETYGDDQKALMATTHTAWQQVIAMRGERLVATLEDCDGMFQNVQLE